MIRRIVTAVVKRTIAQLGYRLSPIKNNPGDFLDVNRALMQNIVQNSPCVFDIGANVGQSVDWILPLFPTAEIYCFEPHEGAFNQLISKYGSLPNVRCWKLAIGEENGTCELIENSKSVTSSLLRATARLDQENIYQPLRKVVNDIRRLDTLVVEIGIKKIDLLKIDVQGYEQYVLNGLGELLTPPFVQAIFMELNFAKFYESQSDPGKVISYLAEKGYKCYGIYEIHANYEDGITFLDALFIPSKVG